MDVKKSQRVPPFTFFGTVTLFKNLIKNFCPPFNFFSNFLQPAGVSQSPKGPPFKLWALDMAPTLAVLGLFFDIPEVAKIVLLQKFYKILHCPEWPFGNWTKKVSRVTCNTGGDQRVPLSVFSALWDFFSKNFFECGRREYFDTLKSFCYFVALDMAPTWTGPGLFFDGLTQQAILSREISPQFLGVGKNFRLLMQSCCFFSCFFSPDLFMKISNFSKTVHTIFTKFCTVILHPKGPLRVQRHQNRMAWMWET